MFLKAKEKSDSCEIFAEVTFAKINFREVLGEAQFTKINACQMSKRNSRKLIFVKTFPPKVGHTNQVSSRYDDDSKMKMALSKGQTKALIFYKAYVKMNTVKNVKKWPKAEFHKYQKTAKIVTLTFSFLGQRE